MLISLVVTLIIVGLLLWLVGMLPIDPAIKQIIRVIVIIFVVLWLVNALGLFGAGFGNFGAIHPCR
jgi:hypothetical protein